MRKKIGTNNVTCPTSVFGFSTPASPSPISEPSLAFSINNTLSLSLSLVPIMRNQGTLPLSLFLCPCVFASLRIHYPSLHKSPALTVSTFWTVFWSIFLCFIFSSKRGVHIYNWDQKLMYPNELYIDFDFYFTCYLFDFTLVSIGGHSREGWDNCHADLLQPVWFTE